MLTHTINGTTLRARTAEALFLKIARALGGKSYLARLDSWTEDGERTYEITATTYLPRQRCSEVHGRRFVVVR
ncbi:MAG: hypothetical protein ACO3DQ_07430 [Cephaloticoccus sp.]|jgi:hypothetical protein